MNITVPIPDGLAVRLSAGGADLARRALEAFALEEYRADRLTEAGLAQFVGFDGRLALDAFLKARGVFLALQLRIRYFNQGLRQAGCFDLAHGHVSGRRSLT